MNDLGNKGYLVFGLILFVWELLPTTLLVGFFRVHRPPQDLVRASGEGRHWRSLSWVLGVWEASGGQKEASMVAPFPRAPAASSTGRSLAPVPTSSTGHTARMRAALGSIAGVRAPGRSPGPTRGPLGSQVAPPSHGVLEQVLPPTSAHAMVYTR